MLKKRLIISVCVAIFSLTAIYSDSGKTAAQLTEEANRVIRNISVAQVQRLMNAENLTIIDVREKDEYLSGYLPQAVNIPRGLLEFSITAVAADKNAAILIYCKKGGRGALAAQTLQVMGYTNVSNLKGGIEAWIAAEKQIHKP